MDISQTMEGRRTDGRTAVSLIRSLITCICTNAERFGSSSSAAGMNRSGSKKIAEQPSERCTYHKGNAIKTKTSRTSLSTSNRTTSSAKSSNRIESPPRDHSSVPQHKQVITSCWADALFCRPHHLLLSLYYVARMPYIGSTILSVLLLIHTDTSRAGADQESQHLQQGRRNVFSDLHELRPHNDLYRSLPIDPRISYAIIDDDGGAVPYLLRSITYKRRRGRKDVLRVRWGGERSRKGRVVLYGPDGNKIKGRKITETKRTSKDIPLKDGILQPGQKYTVRLFEKSPVSSRSTLLLSTMEYVHPSAPVPPSPQPTKNPTPMPSSNPSARPTTSPSLKPTGMPSWQPSSKPSINPTKFGSAAPSISHKPSRKPSSQPSASPSMSPSVEPSLQPSSSPSQRPSGLPSSEPSALPSVLPSQSPSSIPSSNPSASPSFDPSSSPSNVPSVWPSGSPSFGPSSTPSSTPTSCDALESSCEDEDDISCCPHPSLSKEISCNLSVNFEGVSQNQRCCIEDGESCVAISGLQFDGCCDSTCSDQGSTAGDFRCCVENDGDCYGFSTCCVGTLTCNSTSNTEAGKCV